MVNFLRSWVLNIVTIIIFVTFLEILLPNSSIKKYIKMIVGLLIMLVILSPVLELVNGNIKIENEILKTSAQIEQKSLQANASQLENEQNKQMVAMYKKNMENDIRDRIEHENKVEVLNINLDIDENINSQTFGSIYMLHITLSMDMILNNNKAKAQSIETVSILVGDSAINNTVATNNDHYTIKEIKANISDLYGINEENIKISINKQM